MILASAVQVSAVVPLFLRLRRFVVFSHSVGLQRVRNPRAAPSELGLFGTQIKVAFVWVFFFFFIHSFIYLSPAPRQRLARVVVARLQLHPHCATTCWTVYFGVAECVAKLKPLTRRRSAFPLCATGGLMRSLTFPREESHHPTLSNSLPPAVVLVQPVKIKIV